MYMRVALLHPRSRDCSKAILMRFLTNNIWEDAMNSKIKGMLKGAVVGAAVGCVATAGRLACAACAPLSYPVIGGASSVVSYGAVLYQFRKDIDPTDFAHVAVVTAGAGMSLTLGTAWGVLCIPTAVLEPVLAPCTAIPASIIVGGKIGYDQAPSRSQVDEVKHAKHEAKKYFNDIMTDEDDKADKADTRSPLEKAVDAMRRQASRSR